MMKLALFLTLLSLTAISFAHEWKEPQKVDEISYEDSAGLSRGLLVKEGVVAYSKWNNNVGAGLILLLDLNGKVIARKDFPGVLIGIAGVTHTGKLILTGTYPDVHENTGLVYLVNERLEILKTHTLPIKARSESFASTSEGIYLGSDSNNSQGAVYFFDQELNLKSSIKPAINSGVHEKMVALKNGNILFTTNQRHPDSYYFKESFLHVANSKGEVLSFLKLKSVASGTEEMGEKIYLQLQNGLIHILSSRDGAILKTVQLTPTSCGLKKLSQNVLGHVCYNSILRLYDQDLNLKVEKDLGYDLIANAPLALSNEHFVVASSSGELLVLDFEGNILSTQFTGKAQRHMSGLLKVSENRFFLNQHFFSDPGHSLLIYEM